MAGLSAAFHGALLQGKNRRQCGVLSGVLSSWATSRKPLQQQRLLHGARIIKSRQDSRIISGIANHSQIILYQASYLFAAEEEE